MLVLHGDAAMHGLRVSCKVIIPSERCCINVFRMSWVRVRFSGTMAWLTHAYTLPPFVSRFLHFQHTCTHSAGSRILTFFLTLWKLCCSPDYLSASHSLQNFNKSDICLNAGWFLVQFSSCWLNPAFLISPCLQPDIGLSVPHPSWLSGRMRWTEAIRCWKGRIRGPSVLSVGNQRRGAGRRQQRLEMRSLQHQSAVGLRFVDENPEKGSGLAATGSFSFVWFFFFNVHVLLLSTFGEDASPLRIAAASFLPAVLFF